MNWALAAGSLAAVLMLAAIAWALRLGGDGRVEGEAHAIRLAEDMLAGFDAREAVVCGGGGGAVVLGADGSVALIRPNGARFVVRQVRRPRWRPNADGLTIESGDRVPVRLSLDHAEARRLGERLDAAADNDVSSRRA